MRSFILALFFLAAEANPVELFERGTSAFCLVVDAAVSIAKAQAPATSYCSSYLHISTSTKTTTVKPSPATSTITTGTTTLTSTSTITTTIIEVSAQCTAGGAAKRAASSVAKPACFSSYTVSSVISSACSCLSIPTPTSTVTATSPVSTITVAAASVTIPTSLVITSLATQFALQAGGSGGVGVNGDQIILGTPNGANDYPLDFVQAAGNDWILNAACNLQLVDPAGPNNAIACGSPGKVVLAVPQENLNPSGYSPLVCQIHPSTNELACFDGIGNSYNYYCNDPRIGSGLTWVFGTAQNIGEDCGPFTLLASAN